MLSTSPQAVDARLTRAAIFLVVTLGAGAESEAAARSLCGDLAALVRGVGFRSADGGLSCICLLYTSDIASLNPRTAKNAFARSMSRTTIVRWSKRFSICVPLPTRDAAPSSRVHTAGGSFHDASGRGRESDRRPFFPALARGGENVEECSASLFIAVPPGRVRPSGRYGPRGEEVGERRNL